MSSPERALPAVLVGLTAVTGLVDAVSYLALGHVFTANMTGNVVFLGFALAGAPGLSVMRSGMAVALGYRSGLSNGPTRVHAIIMLTGLAMASVMPPYGSWPCRTSPQRY